jgi:hypothetical protein
VRTAISAPAAVVTIIEAASIVSETFAYRGADLFLEGLLAAPPFLALRPPVFALGAMRLAAAFPFFEFFVIVAWLALIAARSLTISIINGEIVAHADTKFAHGLPSSAYFHEYNLMTL